MLEVFPIDPDAHPNFADRFIYGVHNGTDIFAPADSAVFAVTSGTARNATDTKGGNVVYLTGSDGRVYYYAHLSHWAYEESPRKVEAGDLIGYVGTTGNAKGRPPHVHFEIKTPTVGPIDPFPELAAIAPPHSVIQPKGPSSSTPISSSAPLAAAGSGIAWLLLLLLLWRK